MPRGQTVIVDVPSLSSKQLTISRSGACTSVRGGREPPHGDGATELRGERLYGRFHLLVRVPDQYEKRWSKGTLEHGVLRLSYKADDEPAIS
jgi:HSP20 family molecular chaperone IbpA